jgi:hypothetical protein
MKLLLIYISLLIFSRLIIPLYHITQAGLNQCPAAPQAVVYHAPHKTQQKGFSFYNSIVKKVFPALKNLN